MFHSAGKDKASLSFDDTRAGEDANDFLIETQHDKSSLPSGTSWGIPKGTRIETLLDADQINYTYLNWALVRNSKLTFDTTVTIQYKP